LGGADGRADDQVGSDGPDGVLRRDDLTVRAEKTVWAARHPGDERRVAWLEEVHLPWYPSLRGDRIGQRFRRIQRKTLPGSAEQTAGRERLGKS